MEWKFALLTLLAITLVLAPRLALAQEDVQTVELDTSIGLDTDIGAGAEAGEETDNGAEDVEDPGILPDNPFYDLKLLIEKLQLMFTFNQKVKIRLNMKLAEKRLAEAEQMMLKNKTHIVERLVAKYQERVEEAEQGRERLRLRNITVEDVDEWMNRTTNKHIYVLRRVIEKAPEQAQTGLQRALENAETNKEKIRDRLIERIRRRETTTTTTVPTTTTTTAITTTTTTMPETNETGGQTHNVTIQQGLGVQEQAG